jgi:hypothetical protein
VEIPVARLTDIVRSKRTAGRDKDRLFLATHAEAIRDLLELERKDSRYRGKRRPRRGKQR